MSINDPDAHTHNHPSDPIHVCTTIQAHTKAQKETKQAKKTSEAGSSHSSKRSAGLTTADLKIHNKSHEPGASTENANESEEGSEYETATESEEEKEKEGYTIDPEPEEFEFKKKVKNEDGPASPAKEDTKDKVAEENIDKKESIASAKSMENTGGDVKDDTSEELVTETVQNTEESSTFEATQVLPVPEDDDSESAVVGSVGLRKEGHNQERRGSNESTHSVQSQKSTHSVKSHKSTKSTKSTKSSKSNKSNKNKEANEKPGGQQNDAVPTVATKETTAKAEVHTGWDDEPAALVDVGGEAERPEAPENNKGTPPLPDMATSIHIPVEQLDNMTEIQLLHPKLSEKPDIFGGMSLNDKAIEMAQAAGKAFVPVGHGGNVITSTSLSAKMKMSSLPIDSTGTRSGSLKSNTSNQLQGNGGLLWDTSVDVDTAEAAEAAKAAAVAGGRRDSI